MRSTCGTRQEKCDPLQKDAGQGLTDQACMPWVMKEKKCGPFTEIATAVPMSGTFEGIAHAWTVRAMTTTFADFLDVLLSEKNFLLIKAIGTTRVIRPDWSLCMGYEFELRKEALRLVREKGFSIQRALWGAYNNDTHRLENFLNFMKLDRLDDAEGDKKIQQLQNANQRLEKKVSDLERAMRSRSPRGKGNRKGQQYSLPAPAPYNANETKTKGKGKGKKGKGRGKTNTGAGGQISTFSELMKIKAPNRPNLCAQAKAKPGVCFRWQSSQCTEPSCPFTHVCIGCGGSSPYDQCKCLRT